MIRTLRGIIIIKKAPTIVLEVSGIGYEVSTPISTFNILPEINSEVFLHIHQRIREDKHSLYGFYHEHELNLFELIIKFHKIGPNVALAILSYLSYDEFVIAIKEENIEKLIKIPNVGRKTAERLIIELKDKLTLLLALGNSKSSEFSESNNMIEIDKAIEGLIYLGIKEADAAKVVKNIYQDNMSAQEIITKYLSQHRSK